MENTTGIETAKIRSVLKELHSNDTPTSNKSPIAPSAAPIFKGDLDDSYIRDPRLKLNDTVDQSDLENSYVVPSPISRTKTPEQAIDDLIGNFQNLGVAKPNQNQLLANTHGEAYALSSDEEMFQECESTFDSLNVAAATVNKSILSNSDRQLGHNYDDTFNIATPIAVAHSTKYGIGDDVNNSTGPFQLALDDYDTSIVKQEPNTSIDEQSQGDKTFEEQLLGDRTLEKEHQTDKIFEEVPQNDNTPQKGVQDDNTFEQTAGVPSPNNKTLNKGSEDDKSPEEQSGTTLEKDAEGNKTSEDLFEGNRNPQKELNGDKIYDTLSPMEKADDEQPQGDKTVIEYTEDVAVNVSKESLDLDMESGLATTSTAPIRITDNEPTSNEMNLHQKDGSEATELPCPPIDFGNETHVMSPSDAINSTQVLNTFGTPSAKFTNQTVTMSEVPNAFDTTHIIGSSQVNALNQTVSIVSDPLNATHNLNAHSPSTMEVNQTVTMAQTSPACSQFDATTIINSVTDHSLNETVDLSPTIESLTSSISIPDVIPVKSVANSIPTDVTMDMDSSIELDSLSGPTDNDKNLISYLEQTDSIVNDNQAIPQEEVINNVADAYETETKDIELNTAAGAEALTDEMQKTPDSEARRLSIRQDLFDNLNENKIETIAIDRDVFKVPFPPQPFSSAFSNSQFGVTDKDFQTNGMILNPSDFDFLLSKGEPSSALNNCRDSILERFDPLSGRVSVLPTLPVSTVAAISTAGNYKPIAATQFSIIEEQESANETLTGTLNDTLICKRQSIDIHQLNGTKTLNAKLDSKSSSLDHLDDDSQYTTIETSSSTETSETYATAPIEPNPIDTPKINTTMSVGLIQDMNNENMKTLEIVSNELNDRPSPKLIEDNNVVNDRTRMNDDNNVIHEHAEDLEKKLREAERREETLIRRITEKDKAMNKMSAVMENYEKTMVEMISEREQTTKNFEKQLGQLKAERDSNQHHLLSLETTFSDLHVKYEKSKQTATEVKDNESLLMEKLEFAQQQIKSQELRYDKLKNHALSQLEGANAKLETLTRNHAIEMKKLQAQLKKEEVSRQSIMEQLAQKTKENEELVKICDELINNGPDGS